MTAGDRAPYTSPLRDRQKEQTRALILEAVASIISRQGAAPLTIAEVAQAAQVTERTIYRHFKNRDELLSAFWPWVIDRMGGIGSSDPVSLADFLERLPQVFDGWAREENLIRAVFFSAESRKIRAPAIIHLVDRLSAFLVEEVLAQATEVERREVATSIMTLCSAANWIFMRDCCGCTGPQAAAAAARGIELILLGVKSTGPDRPVRLQA